MCNWVLYNVNQRKTHVVVYVYSNQRELYVSQVRTIQCTQDAEPIGHNTYTQCTVRKRVNVMTKFCMVDILRWCHMRGQNFLAKSSVVPYSAFGSAFLPTSRSAYSGNGSLSENSRRQCTPSGSECRRHLAHSQMYFTIQLLSISLAFYIHWVSVFSFILTTRGT